MRGSSWFVMIAVAGVLLIGTSVAFGDSGIKKTHEMKVEVFDGRGTLDPPVNDQCEGAIDVSAGFSGVASTAEALDDYDPGSGGCTGFQAAGPDIAYLVDLAPGYRVIATMDPVSYFDASLYMVTDCGDVVGTCVVGDDSGNPESITYCSEEGGIYYIICDGYAAGSWGDFYFDVLVEPCPTAQNNGTCGEAIEVFDGSSIDGTTVGSINDYDSGACTCCGSTGADVVYYVQLAAHEQVAASIDGNFDTVLYIVTDCDDIWNTCCAGDDIWGSGESVTCCSDEGGLYYIIVDGWNEQEGDFTLDIAVGPCESQDCDFPPHDTCDEAITFCGDVNIFCNDTTTGATNDYDPGYGGCTGYGAEGPDVVYRIVLLPGGSLYASMDGAFDASLYLVTDCDDVPGSCVVGSDSAYGFEEISWASVDGGIFYLIADGYAYYSYGEFLLTINIIGGGPSAVEETTWSGVKAMYR